MLAFPHYQGAFVLNAQQFSQ